MKRSERDAGVGPVVIESAGLGPFTTRRVLSFPDGSEGIWESRSQRIGRHSSRRPGVGASPNRRFESSTNRRQTHIIAALFMIGSTLFALASIPVFFSSVPAGLIALTYFVGSLFFACAAYLSFLQVVNPVADPFQTSDPGPGRYRLLGWSPR